MVKTGILLAMVGGVSAWATSHVNSDMSIQPQQTIHLVAQAWGCTSRESLDSALTHERAGQNQARQQLFDDQRCMSMPAGGPYRVVSVDRHDVQFASADNRDQQGLWIDSRFVRR